MQPITQDGDTKGKFMLKILEKGSEAIRKVGSRSGSEHIIPDAQHCLQITSKYLCLSGDDGPRGVEVGEGDQVHENTQALAAQYLHNILPVQDQLREEQHQPAKKRTRWRRKEITQKSLAFKPSNLSTNNYH
jgi:hypothetical protein